MHLNRRCFYPAIIANLYNALAGCCCAAFKGISSNIICRTENILRSELLRIVRILNEIFQYQQKSVEMYMKLSQIKETNSCTLPTVYKLDASEYVLDSA